MFRKPYSVNSHQKFINKLSAIIGRWEYVIHREYVIHPIVIMPHGHEFYMTVQTVLMPLITLLRYK